MGLGFGGIKFYPKPKNIYYCKSRTKYGTNLRKWRIHVWIILPSAVPMEKGRFPKKWRTIDIFPEMKLEVGKNKIEMLLRKNLHENRKQSNYILEFNVNAESSEEALEMLGDKIEIALDILIFQLQAPIPVTHFEVLDCSTPLMIGEERDLIFANSFPRIQKDCGFTFMTNWATSINPRLMQAELDADTEAALRWFSKGITSRPIVDQFTSFWIALEILTLPSKPRKRIFFQCRKCDYEITSCPQCSYSTLHFPDIKERIERFITKDLGLNETTFESLWDARMLFHGRNKLTPEEIEKISDMTWKLRIILVNALKNKLGIDLKNRPYCISPKDLVVMADKFILGGSKKLTELDIEYAKSR